MWSQKNIIQSHLKPTFAFTRDGWGEVIGARENGRGMDLLVRPPGREMLSTLHPGKGSLRSSGPICSRRGKWHIIGSRPDKGICVYYITRHQAHLSFITYIPPSHQEREKGEWEREKEGQCESHLKLHTEGAFYARSGWYSARHLSPSFFLFCFQHWEPVKYNNTGVHPGTPKTILPTGIFGEILETHHRAHPTLLSSQTNGTVWTDFRIMELYGCR